MDAVFQKRLASAVIGLTGLWVVISPLFISMSNAAIWNALIAGGLLTILGVSQMLYRSSLPSILGLVTSIWLGASALIIDQSIAAMWSLVIAGVIGIVASSWDVTATQDDGGRHKISFSS